MLLYSSMQQLISTVLLYTVLLNWWAARAAWLPVLHTIAIHCMLLSTVLLYTL